MRKVEEVSYPYLCGAVDQYNAGTNDFTGSISFEGKEIGAFREHFNYKLHLHAEDKKPIKIEAYWYVGALCFDKTDSEKITVKKFEPSDEGAAQAVKWLQSEYDRIK